MKPKKILVIKLRALGDTVILTAPLIAIREAYPAAQIHVVVTSSWVDVLNHHPAVNHIWPYERREERSARAKNIARLALKLRKEHYDTVINFHASPSSSMLAFATGAKTRSIHFHGHRQKNRYSNVNIPGKGTVKPITERDMDAVRALGNSIAEGRTPKMYLTDSETAEIEKQKKLASGPLLAIGLGASRPTKIWPIERFVEVSEKWKSETGGSVLLIEGPGEDALTEKFLSLSQAAKEIEVLKSATIRELAVKLAAASVYLGNDSGPKHLAAAVGTPTVTFIGPEHPYEWHPYPESDHPYLYIKDLPCRTDADPGQPAWCALQVCEKEQHRCMTGLSTDEALKHCLKLV